MQIPFLDDRFAQPASGISISSVYIRFTIGWRAFSLFRFASRPLATTGRYGHGRSLIDKFNLKRPTAIHRSFTSKTTPLFETFIYLINKILKNVKRKLLRTNFMQCPFNS